MKKQTYDLEERLLEYSVRIIKVVEQLPNTRVGNHVAGQLLKSGTSPYPNHGEAQAAESPKDFIHKLRISLKELRESQRWLKLIQRVPLIKKSELLDGILQETEELTTTPKRGGLMVPLKGAINSYFSFTAETQPPAHRLPACRAYSSERPTPRREHAEGIFFAFR